MAKSPSSVIGIDIGRYALKAVVMQRKSHQKLVLTHYAVRELTAPIETSEQIFTEVKALIAAAGGTAKHLAAAVSGSDSIIRIIEQPETPTEMLRNAIRINGPSLLNQDVRDYVLDCSMIPSADGAKREKARYLVGGLRRKHIELLDDAFQKEKADLEVLQLSAIATFNAFEFAYDNVFNNEAFMLVDIGHQSSTIGVGVKKELILVRVLEYGGNALVEALTASGGQTRAAALQALEDGDEDSIEKARISLAALTREISSSIGFFEGRREENISRVFVSGGAAGSRAVLQVMAEELHMPCMAWNPLERCEVALAEDKKNELAYDVVNLHAACGVAIEFLKKS